MFVKKNGKWEDEGGEVTADKLQEVIENNQEQLGSVIQEACIASSGEGIIGGIGANGVSGFLPDYSKQQVLTVTRGKDSNGYTTSYAIAPEDGWGIVLLKNIKISSTVASNWVSVWGGYTNNTGNTVTRTNNYSYLTSVWYTIMIPVHKGYAFGCTHSSSVTSDITDGFIFCPIYKPDFTQEHIVGYLGDKPIYERTFEATTLASNTSASIKNVSDWNIDKCLDIHGMIYSSVGNIPIPYAYGSETFVVYYLDTAKTLNMQIKNSTSSCFKKPCILIVRYTKTID